MPSPLSLPRETSRSLLPSAVSAAAPSPAAGILSKASCTSPGKSAESGELFQVSKETEWRGSEAVAWGVEIVGGQTEDPAGDHPPGLRNPGRGQHGSPGSPLCDPMTSTQTVPQFAHLKMGVLGSPLRFCFLGVEWGL